MSDQLKTTHIHGLALYGFDLDVIQSVLFNGIGEIIQHSQDFGGYLCFKRSVKCLLSVTITSWLNGQLVKIHLPERSFSQGRLVLSKTITSLLNGKLVKIHLPEVLSGRLVLEEYNCTCQRFSQRRHGCSNTVSDNTLAREFESLKESEYWRRISTLARGFSQGRLVYSNPVKIGIHRHVTFPLIRLPMKGCISPCRLQF